MVLIGRWLTTVAAIVPVNISTTRLSLSRVSSAEVKPWRSSTSYWLDLDAPTPTIKLDIARVTQRVRNYCNINEIPEALNFTIADMVLDLQSARSGGNVTITDVDMGDTSYSFDLDASIDGLVNDYRANLSAFRRLRW